MKKVLMSIQLVIHVHVSENNTVVHPVYNGTVWGASIHVYNHCFDLCDEAGYIVFTGSVRDLHARVAGERTFEDGEYMEFDYTHVENCYVGF